MGKKILLMCLLFCSITAMAQQKLQEINPVLRDQSFTEVFGFAPDATTPEQLRIQTHLAYVEQLLRARPVEGLTEAQQSKRTRILDHLRNYWMAGQFPVNIAYPGERRPCFIDDNGTICAVGYLIEQTKGREAAEAINAAHQYDFLPDMNEPVIEEWATEYGVTLEECAMIQPAYGWPGIPADRTVQADIKSSYGIASGFAGGINIACNVANFSGRMKSPAFAYVGLATGTGQIILGLANIKKSVTTGEMSGDVTTTYKAQNNLSYLNIAMGTTTLISSAVNLMMQKKNKNNRNAFNLYSAPGYRNSFSMGLSLTRSI